jgi:hypothetical protein
MRHSGMQDEESFPSSHPSSHKFVFIVPANKQAASSTPFQQTFFSR